MHQPSHDITEILLKVASNTINLNLNVSTTCNFFFYISSAYTYTLLRPNRKSYLRSVENSSETNEVIIFNVSSHISRN